LCWNMVVVLVSLLIYSVMAVFSGLLWQNSLFFAIGMLRW
jgi:hypothetical protein